MPSAIRAYVFDAYGTLFDVAAPVSDCAGSLGADAPRLAATWRERQLQYTWLRSLQGRFADFAQVTADALDHAMAALGRTDPDLRACLLDAYRTPRAHPEVHVTIAALRARGMRTAILSNGTADWLHSAICSAGLDGMFEAVLSADIVRVYKPHPAVYALAEDALQVAAREISFQSSNGWDAWSASAYGMRAVWCNRGGNAPEFLPEPPEHTISTLDELLRLPPFPVESTNP